MNFPDLLARKDRAVLVESGRVELIPTKGMKVRGITLSDGAVLRLRDAHEYSALRSFPTEVSWYSSDGDLRVLIESGGGTPVCLAAAKAGPIVLDWPTQALSGPFDLLLRQQGDPVTLQVGRTLDPRAKMRPLLRGRGLELGPGLVPRIRPSECVDIEYVEERTPKEWDEIYGRGRVSMDELTQDVLDRYRVGSALTLEEWAPKSLDFIFSNHVFEHLMNPLQVLRNWLGRLKVGGHIFAVVPDARYTFDLRQPFSKMDEILAELERGGYAVPDEKYHRWCRYTAPYNTVENLKERGYSIHVHYYTPEAFRDMVEYLIVRDECSGIFFDTVPNNKEFGVIIRR
jgi:SAM-dependent methyltransferase